jgi:hypothetical protein
MSFAITQWSCIVFVSAVSISDGFEIFLAGLAGHGCMVDELTFPLYMLEDCVIL